MAHSLFPRKDGDSVVTIIELNILYCICSNVKLDVCHAIALKLKDVATKMARAIKIGGLVTNIACYVGFDADNIPFEKLKGHSLIDLSMMEAIGMVTKEGPRHYNLVNAPPPQQMDEEEERADIYDVIRRMDDLELQVGVIDSNVGELTSLAHSMNTNIAIMRQDINMINHNLMAYF